MTLLEWDITVDVFDISIFEQYECPDCKRVEKVYEEPVEDNLGLPDTVVCPKCNFNMKSLTHSEGQLSFETTIDKADLKRIGKTEAEVNQEVGKMLLVALEQGIKDAKENVG